MFCVCWVSWCTQFQTHSNITKPCPATVMFLAAMFLAARFLCIKGLSVMQVLHARGYILAENKEDIMVSDGTISPGLILYNIVSGHMYFPSSIFLQSNLPYQFICTSTLNFIRPFAHTNYMYHSFVPSVVSSWNNLPDSIKWCSCVSFFKRSLLYHFDALGSY